MRCTQFRINAAHGLTEFRTKLLLGATFARHDVHLGTSKPRFLPQSKHTVSLSQIPTYSYCSRIYIYIYIHTHTHTPTHTPTHTHMNNVYSENNKKQTNNTHSVEKIQSFYVLKQVAHLVPTAINAMKFGEVIITTPSVLLQVKSDIQSHFPSRCEMVLPL